MAEKRAETMKLSGNDYAKVAERIKLFRSDWPKGKIETDYKELPDGKVQFKAWIWKDKTEYLSVLTSVKDRDLARGSADADGSATNVVGKKEKDFEKLQTIAVGRALAMLGYLSSGDVASFEEMEEFGEYKKEQHALAVRGAISTMEQAAADLDMDALKRAFVATSMTNDPEVIAAKDRLKADIEKINSQPPHHDSNSDTATAPENANSDTDAPKTTTTDTPTKEKKQ